MPLTTSVPTIVDVTYRYLEQRKLFILNSVIRLGWGFAGVSV